METKTFYNELIESRNDIIKIIGLTENEIKKYPKNKKLLSFNKRNKNMVDDFNKLINKVIETELKPPYILNKKYESN